ncbi:MAG TPA: VWA domain-containing protein [Steroidobacteraceae bacterium]|nr:VWA domain-containing protein [Steroidobacteraceae bacterium]
MNPVTHFGQPLWMVGGLCAVVAALLLFWRFDRLQRRRLLAFSVTRPTDSALYAVSRALLWSKRTAFCLAVLAASIALARPLGSLQMQESERRGTDILFAIDTSRSMLTPDVKPNRLARAKLAVEDLLDHLTGDGVGLVAFAGEAFLQAPVTNDYDAFRETLESLDTRTIALGGTDLAAAIRLSQSTLALRGDTQKIMVLITDGEDLAGDALVAAQAAAKNGMIIFTVGVGTAAGELIPVPDAAGNVQFVKDPAGNFVKSHLDSQMLTQIAAATGGVYTPLGPQGQGVVNLYEQRLKGFSQRQHTDRQIAVYAELFQWPLGAAIVLLLLDLLLGVSVRRRLLYAAPAKAMLVVALLVALTIRASPTAWATPLTAQDEYNKGEYPQAQRDYAESLKRDPGSRLQFNLGAAAYKAHDFTAAATAFNNALKTRDVPLQQSAYYNLGNTLFRQGEKGAATDPQTTMKTWQQSIGAYDTALQLQPADQDAKFNRSVVQRRLDELKRQQQQKQNDKNPQQNQQKQQDQKDQQKQKDQQPQQNHPEQQSQQNQQGQQNQQNQQNQQGQQQNQQNQPGQQSQPNQQAGQPGGPTQPEQGRAADQKAQQSAAAAAQDIGKPDQMSRLEAEQLLDSAKGEEGHVPIGMANGKPTNAPQSPLRDW